MIAMLLILAATFSHEVAASIGKRAFLRGKESIYTMGFLGLFWVAIFMALGVVVLGADFYLTTDSLPTLIPRIILECGVVYFGVKGSTIAERSTVGFITMLTLPLLMVVDIMLGYTISPLQIAGVGLLFVGVWFLFSHSKKSKKGVPYLVVMALLAVGTTSLFKYDITHFNSVAAEQIVASLAVMIFFSVLAKVHGKPQPIRYVTKPGPGLQSFCAGASLAIMSVAFLFAAPSVIIAFKRGFALLWSIIFGHKWFHEHKLAVKLRAASLALVGLILISFAV